MINEREPEDVSPRAFGDGPLGSKHFDAPGLIGATFVGVLLGGFVGWVLRSFRFGTEPPIRVKGGSMYLDLGSGTAVWKEIGNCGMKWTVTGDKKMQDNYLVSIVTSSDACIVKSRKGETIELEFSSETLVMSVKLKAHNKKTIVTSSVELKCPEPRKSLILDAPGYISKLKVDSYECKFSRKDELDHALLTEF